MTTPTGELIGNWDYPIDEKEQTAREKPFRNQFTPPTDEERQKDQEDSDNGLIPIRTIKLEKFTPKPLRDKLIWVGVDLDGTLAAPLWTPDNPTSDIGDPITRNIEKVIELVKAGYKIIVHTSRPWTDYQLIEQWLLHWNIPFKEIQCGKPLYAAYVDDRAIHADAESWLPHAY